MRTNDGGMFDLGPVVCFEIKMEPELLSRYGWRVSYRPKNSEGATFSCRTYREACEKVAECAVFIADAMMKASKELPPRGKGRLT
ncbi:MAG TPA: hypothetical protein VNE82_03480 [Candidatus Binataceae bacterium]|nr:hypothetical protein [Candidatus Binataceae bacterium]